MYIAHLLRNGSETAFAWWGQEERQFIIRCLCGGVSETTMVKHPGTGIQDIKGNCSCGNSLSASIVFLR